MLVSRSVPLAAAVAAVLATAVALPAGPAAAEAAGAAAAPADAGPAEPVTTIPLTDASGAPTPVATRGIEAAGAGLAAARADGTSAVVATAAAAATSRAGTVRTPAAGPADADVAVLTPPMRTEEFLVAGLTWDGADPLPVDARINLRVLEGEEWSGWLEVEEEDGADDAGRSGTDPFVTGGATAVQVAVTGSAGALPADLQVSLIPANPDPESEEVLADPETVRAPGADAAPTTEPAVYRSLGTTRPGLLTAAGPGGADLVAGGTAPAAPSAGVGTGGGLATGAVAAGAAVPGLVAPAGVTTPRPAVVSRAGWGADESLMTWPREHASLQATVVHHTAGSNSYTWSQAPGVVRGIYHYHAKTREWGDIGYNFLVDKWGRVYEGRSGSLAAPAGEMVVGGHARPFNAGTLGISAMGDFTVSGAPSRTPFLSSMANVLAWQYARAGIDLTSPSGLLSNGTPTRPAGQNLPRIFGHKDVSNTSCPGSFYGDLGRLSAMVEDRMPQLFLLNNAWTTAADVQFRYGDKGADVVVGDWDGDGRDGVATRVNQVFSVNNRNAYGAADRLFAYGRPGDTVLVGDWDGDGVDTLVVRRGNAYHVRNSVTSGPADAVIFYGRADDEVVVGDWDGDGVDTLAVRRANAYHVKNSISSGPADRVVFYGRAGDSVVVGDWDGDRVDTFAVRRGNQYLMKNTVASGVADRSLFYGRAHDLTLVGDWDGNRTDTLGVRRP